MIKLLPVCLLLLSLLEVCLGATATQYKAVERVDQFRDTNSVLGNRVPSTANAIAALDQKETQLLPGRGGLTVSPLPKVTVRLCRDNSGKWIVAKDQSLVVHDVQGQELKVDLSYDESGQAVVTFTSRDGTVKKFGVGKECGEVFPYLGPGLTVVSNEPVVFGPKVPPTCKELQSKLDQLKADIAKLDEEGARIDRANDRVYRRQLELEGVKKRKDQLTEDQKQALIKEDAALTKRSAELDKQAADFDKRRATALNEKERTQALFDVQCGSCRHFDPKTKKFDGNSGCLNREVDEARRKLSAAEFYDFLQRLEKCSGGLIKKDEIDSKKSRDFMDAVRKLDANPEELKQKQDKLLADAMKALQSDINSSNKLGYHWRIVSIVGTVGGLWTAGPTTHAQWQGEVEARRKVTLPKPEEFDDKTKEWKLTPSDWAAVFHDVQNRRTKSVSGAEKKWGNCAEKAASMCHVILQAIRNDPSMTCLRVRQVYLPGHSWAEVLYPDGSIYIYDPWENNSGNQNDEKQQWKRDSEGRYATPWQPTDAERCCGEKK